MSHWGGPPLQARAFMVGEKGREFTVSPVEQDLLAPFTRYRIRVSDPAGTYSAEGDSCAELRKDAREMRCSGPYVIEAHSDKRGWLEVERGTLW